MLPQSSVLHTRFGSECLGEKALWTSEDLLFSSIWIGYNVFPVHLDCKIEHSVSLKSSSSTPHFKALCYGLNVYAPPPPPSLPMWRS